MTYKELLNLYKNGQLSDEQKKAVKADIEKQEAISEFLFENDEIPELEDSCLKAEIAQSDNDFDEKRFQKMIKKSIRKAFLKLGVGVGVIVLALVIVASTVMPNIVDAMYYDPTKIVGTTEEGNNTSRLSVDTMVYTELFTPGYYRNKAYASHKGYGKYDVEIFQSFTINGQINNVYGRIDKNTLTLFSDSVFKLPAQNVFTPDNISGVMGHGGAGAAGNQESALRKLSELDETDYYVAYITFDKVMNYDEFVAWSKDNDIYPHWGAVCRKQDEKTYIADGVLGFNYFAFGGAQAYDREKYPYLDYGDVIKSVDSDGLKLASSDVIQKHVTSMLSYAIDNDTFFEMAGCPISESELMMYIESIEDYGLFTYGFAMVAQKDEILKTSKNENVSYICTAPLN
ncbi:MAG: anti sigma factor C-terminal domain-containing protein [Clostridia bacterium]|nr:anti sigma factor C-terminal domain-containing protein [Clostridia bacterium]